MIVHAPSELLYLSAIPWGIVMCSEESIMRATIAVLMEPSKKPLAYGLYGLAFGAVWALGGYVYTALLVEFLYMFFYAFIVSIIAFYLYVVPTKQTKSL